MSTTHQDKSSGKPRQRSRKADQRGQKGELQSPKLGQRDEDQIGATVASTDASMMSAAAPSDIGEASPVDQPLISEAAPVDQPLVSEVAPADAPLIGEVLPADIPSTDVIGRADNYPISIQTVANAYGDYTRRSFEESRLFVEKLMAVRSLDKVIELQSEFARQSYVNLVAESQKIYGLYSELAKQIFGPWERLAASLFQAGR